MERNENAININNRHQYGTNARMSYVPREFDFAVAGGEFKKFQKNTLSMMLSNFSSSVFASITGYTSYYENNGIDSNVFQILVKSVWLFSQLNLVSNY